MASKPPDKGGLRKDATKATDDSSKDDKKKSQPSKSTMTLEVPKWLFFSMSVFMGFISVVIGGYFAYIKIKHRYLSDGVLFNVGKEGIMLFEMHDRDSDGYLSIEEFEPLIYKLIETNATGEIYSLPIKQGDEIVSLNAYFEPLKLETMTKDLEDQFGNVDALAYLKKWTLPAFTSMHFGASHFAFFLPSNTEYIDLGKVYRIIDTEKGYFDLIGARSVSSNRFFPPHVADRYVFIHQLLTMFHPRPFIITRFGPTGGVAVVRAYNDHLLEIYFRIHAEFQLNEPPFHPFWFTPAQFAGSVIMTRDASHVLYFNMYVPNDKKLNVDMEWLNGPKESDMEVDIGYMPLMQLNNSVESWSVRGDEQIDSSTIVIPDENLASKAENVEWSSFISVDDARRAMEIHMYPFKKIPYYNFSEVFKQADKEQKLVHTILLWGALDDQSC